MLSRKYFTWDVSLASDSGQTLQRQFRSFWSPEKVSRESVAEACAAMETAASKGKRRYVGISAQAV